jgi:hypothetical protein
MDRNPNESILELQNEMEETRRSMAQTFEEIRQEVAEGLDWQSYVRRYPAPALAVAGGVGWMIGRRLGKQTQVSSADLNGPAGSSQIHSRSSTALSRIADRAVSLLASQIMAVLAVHLNDFLSSPPRNP